MKAAKPSAKADNLLDQAECNLFFKEADLKTKQSRTRSTPLRLTRGRSKCGKSA